MVVPEDFERPIGIEIRINGPRRTGKTYIMMEIIRMLGKEGYTCTPIFDSKCSDIILVD